MSTKTNRMGRNPFEPKLGDRPTQLDISESLEMPDEAVKSETNSKFPWNLIRWLAIDLPADIIVLGFKTVLVAQYAVKAARKAAN